GTERPADDVAAEEADIAEVAGDLQRVRRCDAHPSARGVKPTPAPGAPLDRSGVDWTTSVPLDRSRVRCLTTDHLPTCSHYELLFYIRTPFSVGFCLTEFF